MRAKVEADLASQSLAENINGADMLMKALKEEKVEILFGYREERSCRYTMLFTKPPSSTCWPAMSKAPSMRLKGMPGYLEDLVLSLQPRDRGDEPCDGNRDAMMDSLPLVIFTGQVASNVIGNGCLPGSGCGRDHHAITKHNYQVRDLADLPA